MICSKCGKELSEVARFCDSCGTPTVPEREHADTVAPPPETRLPDEPLPLVAEPEAEQEFLQAPKRRMSIGLLIALGVLGLLVVAAAVTAPVLLTYTAARQSAQRKTCQSNLRNIESAIEMYGATSPDETYPSSLEDLISPDMRVLQSIPTCPSGNKEYIWVEGDIGKPPSASCPNRSDHTI